jgi:hypothetical protein
LVRPAAPDRSLAALGMDGVPARDPLTYPGRVITEPALLCESQLLELTPTAERLGRWRTPEASALDATLEELAQSPTGERHPVIAVGSNAAPGQVRHKLARLGVPAVVPMTPLLVSGLGVGVSGHIALPGYVASSPFADSEGEADVVLTLLDDEQLQVVDGTELPRYRRVLLPGTEFPMELPSGEGLEAAYLYVNAKGVLANGDGTPHTPVAQPELLAELLERSSRLRALFDSPEDWVATAAAHPEARAEGQRVFEESGWVLPQEALLRYASDQGEALVYDDVSSL